MRFLNLYTYPTGGIKPVNLWKKIKSLLVGQKITKPDRRLLQSPSMTVDEPQNNAMLAAQLLLIAKREKASAINKCNHLHQWGAVGALEMQAVESVIHCINSVPLELDHQEYRKILGHHLGELARQGRDNSSDEDGYGLGTVHAVGSILTEYTG